MASKEYKSYWFVYNLTHTLFKEQLSEKMRHFCAYITSFDCSPKMCCDRLLNDPNFHLLDNRKSAKSKKQTRPCSRGFCTKSALFSFRKKCWAMWHNFVGELVPILYKSLVFLLEVFFLWIPMSGPVVMEKAFLTSFWVTIQNKP